MLNRVILLGAISVAHSVFEDPYLTSIVYKFVYSNEKLCGDPFRDPQWLPAIGECTIDCEPSSKLCLLHTETKQQRCRDLPPDCIRKLKLYLGWTRALTTTTPQPTTTRQSGIDIADLFRNDLLAEAETNTPSPWNSNSLRIRGETSYNNSRVEIDNNNGYDAIIPQSPSFVLDQSASKIIPPTLIPGDEYLPITRANPPGYKPQPPSPPPSSTTAPHRPASKSPRLPPSIPSWGARIDLQPPPPPSDSTTRYYMRKVTTFPKRPVNAPRYYPTTQAPLTPFRISYAATTAFPPPPPPVPYYTGPLHRPLSTDQRPRNDRTSGRSGTVDFSTQCCEWALNGLCDRSWRKIRKLCPKSCGKLLCEEVEGVKSCTRKTNIDAEDCFEAMRVHRFYGVKTFKTGREPVHWMRDYDPIRERRRPRKTMKRQKKRRRSQRRKH